MQFGEVLGQDVLDHSQDRGGGHVPRCIGTALLVAVDIVTTIIIIAEAIIIPPANPPPLLWLLFNTTAELT